jgi:hypothetical protein
VRLANKASAQVMPRVVLRCQFFIVLILFF